MQLSYKYYITDNHLAVGGSRSLVFEYFFGKTAGLSTLKDFPRLTIETKKAAESSNVKLFLAFHRLALLYCSSLI